MKLRPPSFQKQIEMIKEDPDSSILLASNEDYKDLLRGIDGDKYPLTTDDLSEYTSSDVEAIRLDYADFEALPRRALFITQERSGLGKFLPWPKLIASFSTIDSDTQNYVSNAFSPGDLLYLLKKEGIQFDSFAEAREALKTRESRELLLQSVSDSEKSEILSLFHSIERNNVERAAWKDFGNKKINAATLISQLKEAESAFQQLLNL